jgi:hypothetical protein
MTVAPQKRRGRPTKDPSGHVQTVAERKRAQRAVMSDAERARLRQAEKREQNKRVFSIPAFEIDERTPGEVEYDRAIELAENDPRKLFGRVDARRVTNNQPDEEILRTEFDSDDPFMTRPQKTKIRKRARLNPKISEWLMSNKNVRRLIASVFPKSKTSPLQRKRAERWIGVIDRYHRRGASEGTVAEELGLNAKQVRETLKYINRALRGRRANNSGYRSCSTTIVTGLRGPLGRVGTEIVS